MLGLSGSVSIDHSWLLASSALSLGYLRQRENATTYRDIVPHAFGSLGSRPSFLHFQFSYVPLNMISMVFTCSSTYVSLIFLEEAGLCNKDLRINKTL